MKKLFWLPSLLIVGIGGFLFLRVNLFNKPSSLESNILIAPDGQRLVAGELVIIMKSEMSVNDAKAIIDSIVLQNQGILVFADYETLLFSVRFDLSKSFAELEQLRKNISNIKGVEGVHFNPVVHDLKSSFKQVLF